MNKKQSILITGGAGYIGSMLSTELVKIGYKVTVLDNLTYKKNSLSHLKNKKNFRLIVGSVLNKSLIKRSIKNHDFIIPLAGLVGAPLCDKFPKLARLVNLESVIFMRKCLEKNQKVIFATTNSGYGVGKKNKFCTERSKLNPISLYGRTKVDAEKTVMTFKNTVAFRLATVFGYSYRMRTDLLVNFLVNMAIRNKKITIFEPHFRRNYIHVIDVANAFIFALENFSKMKGNIYNVGLSNANLTKLQLAKRITKNIKGIKINLLKNKKDPDKRDYFVSNKKIEKLGFRPSISLDDGIIELKNLFNTFNFRDNKNNY